MSNLVNDPNTVIFKALAHPIRCSVIDLLHDNERCVCYMEAYLGLRQAYLSQQLRILREAGLITCRRDGWNIYYRLADESVFELLIIAEKLTCYLEENKNNPDRVSVCPKDGITKELA